MACVNVTVEDSLCAWNKRQGLFFEFSPGPFLARRNILAFNGDQSLFVDTVGDCEIRQNLIWAGPPPAPNQGVAGGGADLGQGYRQNDHALIPFTPGNQFEVTRNLLAGGMGTVGPLFSLHNRVRLGQDSCQELQAWQAEASAVFVLRQCVREIRWTGRIFEMVDGALRQIRRISLRTTLRRWGYRHTFPKSNMQ